MGFLLNNYDSLCRHLPIGEAEEVSHAQSIRPCYEAFTIAPYARIAIGDRWYSRPDTPPV